MITKTDYLSYLQCSKRLWLEKHQPGRASLPDPSARRRMRMGSEVGRLAEDRFPDGERIPYRPDPQDMAPLTEQALAGGLSTLFQATFSTGELLIKADILTRGAAGWHLIEVKSTTGVKDEHLFDLAFQRHVLQRAGLQVTQAGVMHLNKNCTYPALDDLFIVADLSTETEALLPQVAADIMDMQQLIERTAVPQVDIGRFCSKPQPCPFYQHCWRRVYGLTIFDIPRLNAEKEQTLRDMDVLYLPDIPHDFPLSPAQNSLVRRIVEEQIDIDSGAIQEKLSGLEYPLYFFDFETIDHAVPTYNGCSPYQQVPFQYSCHILDEDGRLTHREYLHRTADDPRPSLLAAMLDDIGPTGHIVVYYAPFERGVLGKLAGAFPETDDRLQEMIDRLWDQYDIIKQHVQHHAFGKSKSLKSVLPVLVPELSYEPLAIRDGSAAQAAWEEMIAAENDAEKGRLTADLRAYCHLDTLAMVEMHHVLCGLS